MQLPPPHLVLLHEPRAPRVLHDLLLSADADGRLAAAQADEASNLAALFLERHVRGPLQSSRTCQLVLFSSSCSLFLLLSPPFLPPFLPPSLLPLLPT